MQSDLVKLNLNFIDEDSLNTLIKTVLIAAHFVRSDMSSLQISIYFLN
jgi:hypothetical protein